MKFEPSCFKFATLYGEKRYNCLILHVDPGNKESIKGKMIQNEIQQLLHFDTEEMRSFALKKNEVFIPFEVIDTKDKLQLLKDFVSEQYEIFIKTTLSFFFLKQYIINGRILERTVAEDG